MLCSLQLGGAGMLHCMLISEPPGANSIAGAAMPVPQESHRGVCAPGAELCTQCASTRAPHVRHSEPGSRRQLLEWEQHPSLGKSKRFCTSCLTPGIYAGFAEAAPGIEGSAWQVPSAGPEAIDLMTRLCHWNPARRLSAAEALQHPFFQVGLQEQYELSPYYGGKPCHEGVCRVDHKHTVLQVETPVDVVQMTPCQQPQGHVLAEQLNYAAAARACL